MNRVGSVTERLREKCEMVPKTNRKLQNRHRRKAVPRIDIKVSQ